jgi:hypothetical protein
MPRTTFSLAPQRAQGEPSAPNTSPPRASVCRQRHFQVLIASRLQSWRFRNRTEMNGQFFKRAAGLATKMLRGAPSQI